MDQLESLLPDITGQLPADPQHIVPAADAGGNAELSGLVGKGTVPEAHQLCGDGLVQILQQAEHVGLGAAGIAAADEMDDLHENVPL